MYVFKGDHFDRGQPTAILFPEEGHLSHLVVEQIYFFNQILLLSPLQAI